MSITKEVKKDLISKFSINDKDTGSAEVQIAVQTERINNLIEHFKDISSISNIEGKDKWSTGLTYADINNDGLINDSDFEELVLIILGHSILIDLA